MQLLSKRLLIAASVFMILPLQSGNSQDQQKDSIVDRVNTYVESLKEVNKKSTDIEAKLQNYPDKIQTVDSLLSLVPKKKTVYIRQKILVDRPVKAKPKIEYVDTSGREVEIQYINRPIIQTFACRTYGGDTFRAWQTTDRGLWFKIFKKKKKKHEK